MSNLDDRDPKKVIAANERVAGQWYRAYMLDRFIRLWAAVATILLIVMLCLASVQVRYAIQTSRQCDGDRDCICLTWRFLTGWPRSCAVPVEEVLFP